MTDGADGAVRLCLRIGCVPKNLLAGMSAFLTETAPLTPTSTPPHPPPATPRSPGARVHRVGRVAARRRAHHCPGRWACSGSRRPRPAGRQGARWRPRWGRREQREQPHPAARARLGPERVQQTHPCDSHLAAARHSQAAPAPMPCPRGCPGCGLTPLPPPPPKPCSPRRPQSRALAQQGGYDPSPDYGYGDDYGNDYSDYGGGGGDYGGGIAPVAASNAQAFTNAGFGGLGMLAGPSVANAQAQVRGAQVEARGGAASPAALGRAHGCCIGA
jgi:hypothetical protein